MKLTNRIILLVLLLMVQSLPAYQELRGPYLGQKLPGMEPELFAPGIVSTKTGWEAAVSFSPDMKVMLFTKRASIQGTENRIMICEQKNGVWSRPRPAPFALDVMEYESFFHPAGNRVFFNSRRPRPPGTFSRGTGWSVDRSPDGWGEPKYLPEAINGEWVMSITASKNNNLYFTGMRNRKYGIYQTVFRKGIYLTGEYLPQAINSLKGASHPFIAPDENFIIFDAQAGGMGKTSLYISFKNSRGEWMPALKFDKKINATQTEGIASLSPDGKFLFFHRSSDVYWVDAGIIKKMKLSIK